MRINDFLAQVYRVCFHLASVQVYSLSVSCSIKNRCMTAQKQAEAEREQLLQRERAARAEAEQANRIKD